MTNAAMFSYRSTLSVLMVVLAGFIAPSASAQDDLDAALRECASLGDDAARLACFDDIVESRVTARAGPSEPAPSTASSVDEVQPKPLTDDVGKEPATDGDRPREIYSATVIRCERNRRLNEFFFFLENGQVWKMSNYRRPIVGECRFDVTIEKDLFGYKMDIPAKSAAFRVQRVR